MVASTKRTNKAKTLTGEARKVVDTASGVVKAVGDRLDGEARAATGKTRKVIATAADVLKAASVKLDNEAKALVPPVKKQQRARAPGKNAVKVPAQKAVRAAKKADKR